MRDIGKNIRDLRERAGLTQEQLAELLFVTRQTVSNYENGRTRPDVDTVIKIGEVLKADANAVLYGIPVPPERKKSILHLCVTGGIALVLLAAVLWVKWKYAHDAVFKWNFWGTNILVRTLLEPAAMLLTGYTVLGAVALAVGLRTPDLAWIRWVRRVILGLAVFCAVTILPDAVFFIVADIRGMLQDSVNMSFRGIPVLSNIGMWLMRLNNHYAAVWTVPGAVLALLRREKTTE